MFESETNFILEELLDIDSHWDEYNWENLKEGVDVFYIYNRGNDGPAAALIRYAAGAEVPMHLHKGYEHIFVLSGSQSDGTSVFKKGTLIVSHPGSKHRIVSESGCVVLAIWQTPVAFE